MDSRLADIFKGKRIESLAIRIKRLDEFPGTIILKVGDEPADLVYSKDRTEKSALKLVQARIRRLQKSRIESGVDAAILLVTWEGWSKEPIKL